MGIVAYGVPAHERPPAEDQQPEDIMTGPIVVGFDASPESAAAADWAGREAARRELPLELVQAWPWPPSRVLGADDAVQWAKEQLRGKEVELRGRLSGIEVTAVHLTDDPADALEGAAKEAAMLVLGSRGLGAVRGYLIGSVSQDVLGRVACPVVLVRAGHAAEDEQLPTADGTSSADAPYREIVVGVDLAHPCDEMLRFAFESAALRAAPLRVVHAWGPPRGSDFLPFSTIGQTAQPGAPAEETLADAVRPWREKHPQADVVTRAVVDIAAIALLEAAEQAGLLVVGRRRRRLPVGAHLGPVTHAAIHHAPCPVAVVPFG